MARKKSSGEIGAQEDKDRREALAVSLEKKAKAAREGALVDTQDLLVVVGNENRDTTGDKKPKDPEPFVFDHDAKAKVVDHIAVASNANELQLVIDGTYYSFAPQFAAGLRRLIDGGTTNLNL
jgi:hypothetical protein